MRFAKIAIIETYSSMLLNIIPYYSYPDDGILLLSDDYPVKDIWIVPNSEHVDKIQNELENSPLKEYLLDIIYDARIADSTVLRISYDNRIDICDAKVSDRVCCIYEHKDTDGIAVPVHIFGVIIDDDQKRLENQKEPTWKIYKIKWDNGQISIVYDNHLCFQPEWIPLIEVERRNNLLHKENN